MTVFSTGARTIVYHIPGPFVDAKYGAFDCAKVDTPSDVDGFDEFAIAGPQDSTNGPASGKVWIFRGFDADAESVCPPPPHSGGVAGELAFEGVISLSKNDLFAQLLHLPPSTFGVLFANPGATTTPAGSLGLCVGGAGLMRLGGVIAVNAVGRGEMFLDNTMPTVAAMWFPTQDWTFQAVFRDVAAPGQVGTTNAIVVRWAP